MKSLRKILKTFGLTLGVVVIAYMVVAPNLATSGKLYGNEFALQLCRWQLSNWKIAAELNYSTFDFSKFPRDEKRWTMLAEWQFDVWAKTNFVWRTDKVKREIVIVCGKEFDNVPASFWTFHRKNPAHAVGYSDGTTGLISPAQFTNLNLNGFVSISSLATNSEFNIFNQ